MAITINAKGTTVPYFKIGKGGITLYQGIDDPSLINSVVENDVWIDPNTKNIRYRTATNTWSVGTSPVVVSTTPPISPDYGTIWYDSGDTGRLYVWDNLQWVDASPVAQGYTGSIGYTGSQGDQGVIGYTGSQGDQGVIGFTGSKGDQGATGYTGSQGTQGVIGYTGSQGIQGIIGYTGSQGVQGIIGFTGSQGIQGVIGYTGSKGDQGIIGYTGSQGIQGVIGYTGSKGDTGLGFSIAKSYASVAELTADTAPTNIVSGQFAIIESGNVDNVENSRLYLWNGTAYSYVSDLSGSQGITGPQGVIGYTGSQGAQGVIGYTGSQGIQGAQGVIGYTGSQGIQGVIGYTGSQGIQGIIGYTGSKGDQGVQGVIGYTGSKGDQGIIGYTGSQGVTAFTGLTDTPTSYVGAANKLLGVNATEDAIGFTDEIQISEFILSAVTAPTAPAVDSVTMYVTASGTSPNREVAYKIKNELGQEIIISSILV